MDAAPPDYPWITDHRPSPRYPIYTRANAGEVFPEPATPLTATLNARGPIEAGWQSAYTRLGTMRLDEMDTEQPCTTGTFGGYFFLNMSMTRLFGVRCPGMTPELVDLQYFGAMPGIPPYVANPGDEYPEATARLGEWLGWAMTTTELPEVERLRAEVHAAVAARPDLTAARDDALVSRARTLLPLFQDVFDHHIETSTLCGVGIGTVAGVCDAVGRPDLITEVIAGAGDVDSAAPSVALWDLSRLVAKSPALTAAFDAGVAGLLGRLDAIRTDAEVSSFLEGFDVFLESFGSRGPNEWELGSLTWAIRPELPLAAVERMRLTVDSEAPVVKHVGLVERREASAAAIREMLAGNDEALGQFVGGLQCALLFSAARERTKTLNIFVVHEQRLAIRELGRRMVERGHIDDIHQIFMLIADELDPFLVDPASFAPVLRRREAEHRALFAVEPPFVFAGEVPPVSTWARRDHSMQDAAKSGDVLTGIPGAPGKATGRARVVLDPSDPTALEPGDVLVAPETNPAWTPLFVPAAAVVVDVGAQITHAVIVSRELGLPCVVSVTNATRRIPDGAMIEVDGAAGTVRLL